MTWGGGQNITTFYERHLWKVPLLFVRGHAFAFEKVCVSAVYLSTHAKQRSTLDSNILERATAVPRLDGGPLSEETGKERWRDMFGLSLFHGRTMSVAP